MRFSFWRDTVNRTFSGNPPKEPVAVLLASALEDLSKRSNGHAKLNKSWFVKVISAREQYLNNNPYPSLDALERYAENTYSTLLYLTLSALPMTNINIDHLASHIGKAQGIATVLRGLPLIAFPPPPSHHSNPTGALALPAGGRQGAVMLPLDVMAQCRVREEDVYRKGSEAPGLRDAVFKVATRSSDHLITARTMLKNLRKGEDVGHEFEHGEEEGHSDSLSATKDQPFIEQKDDISRALGILMPAVATQLWLDRLQKRDFDIFHPSLRSADWKLPLKAFFMHLRGQI
ncbi:MAG: hypothetical protein Q9227_008788 [Pyrenula ochraceoflavens]